MKITDLRTGREFIGDYITTIPGNSTPTDHQLEVYLGILPDDHRYAHNKRPMAHKRVVLQYAPSGYFVVPINKKFAKVES